MKIFEPTPDTWFSPGLTSDGSPWKYRVLRGLMDYDQLEPLATQAALSPSTVRSHAYRIRKAMGVKTIAEAVRAAEEVAFDAAFAFGRLQL